VSREPAREIASQLVRRGLAAPARLLLDAHLPLAPLFSDAGVALRPLLNVVGGQAAGELGALLEDDRAMERLIAELDDAQERHAEPG